MKLEVYLGFMNEPLRGHLFKISLTNSQLSSASLDIFYLASITFPFLLRNSYKDLLLQPKSNSSVPQK